MAAQESSTIQRFINQLEGYVKKNDRGALAHMRRGFSEAMEYYAWPYIAGWCRNLENGRERCIWLTVAAGFATHLENVPESGNMGDVLRKLAIGHDPRKPKEALKSFEGRFRRLLTCVDSEELCRHLTGIIRAAAQKGIPIDFERLYWDLLMWGKPDKKVKIRWAEAYWTAGGSGKGGESE